ncbi:MAG: 2-amino-4-hydroxy-6-hydroxymethyldihydropteridine diphosphokinase [Negativicutes bacterium]
MILIGLGSNMGERDQNLQHALGMLETDGCICIDKVSSIYETAPFGVMDQNDFLNMVVVVKTELSPEKLLHKCLTVENAMGRVRSRHWGPRIIDLDLLIYDAVQMQTDNLTLPHPGIGQRAFVLIPMRDVAMDVQLPGGLTIDSLLAGLSESRKQEVQLWKNVEWDSTKKCFV